MKRISFLLKDNVVSHEEKELNAINFQIHGKKTQEFEREMKFYKIQNNGSSKYFVYLDENRVLAHKIAMNKKM